MEKKTFLEVMAGEGTMRMTYSQKRVLRKVVDAKDPELAATQISSARDSRNLIEASKTLSKYGYITTEPFLLGPDDEPQAVSLTPKGEEAVEEYDIATDPTLVTPEEGAASSPQDAQDFADDAQQAGAGGDEQPSELTGDQPTELEGGDVGLELSSYFRTINDLAKLRG